MKRIIIAAALILAASCSKQDIASENEIIVATGKPFTAVIEQETTKSVLTDAYKVQWESGDRISINGAEYSATPDEPDATKADFTFVSGTDPEAPYKAIFPAILYNAGTLAFPATQNYEPGKFNAPMYAESETENLSFKNICGVICLALKGTESVKTITITANEPVCGAFTLTDATTVSLSGTGRTVTLNCGETGVPLNEEIATKFYIYLPPRTYSAGMNLIVTSTGGGVYEKTTGKAVTIERSNVYTFNWTANFTPANLAYALPGVFSVAPGVQVHFSMGNFYAHKSSLVPGYSYWMWGFYTQYASNSIAVEDGARTATTDDGEIDLFTWGYDATNSIDPTGAEPDNVSVTDGILSQAQDWGSEVMTGLGETSSWRTPTKAEWQYLFEGRANASNLYRCGVTVCGKTNCVVIAPDGWNTTVNPLQDSYSDTSAPMTWAQALSAGLVCLPAAGIRDGASVSYVGSYGNYWSSTATDASNAGYLSFTDSGISISDDGPRSSGRSVRLIREVGVPVESVSLDKSELSIEIGNNATLTATVLPSNATSKDVSWSSSNTAVATVDVTGNVMGVSGGIAVITATTVSGNKTATCKVFVGVVDLGLSVKWASFNLGASYPWEYGSYYQWAGTEDVTDTSIKLDWANCPYHTNSSQYISWTKYVSSSNSSYWSGAGGPDGKTVLDPADDAAYVILGGDWRMPTETEWQELIDNCTWEWTDNYNSKGVAGYIVTSNKERYTDNSIFLPAAEYRYDTDLSLAGSYGSYWSGSLDESMSSEARGLYFYSGDHDTRSRYRYYGQSVRPVLH